MTLKLEKVTDINEMAVDQQELFGLFDELNIQSTTYKHPPIFTVEEGIALNLPELIPGRHGKSLFLKSASQELWLVVACENTQVDLKSLHSKVNTKRFSFAKPDIMIEVLGVTPGSATPFALKNDHKHQVRVILDKDLLESDNCVFHPLINTHSTVISVAHLIHFIKSLGYEPYILPLA
jgi:Ala-tRNA(Pro) deacylase